MMSLAAGLKADTRAVASTCISGQERSMMMALVEVGVGLHRR